ncbi:M24 family metallopeptidase [Sneathiella litorea]|uniref:M24 family metallopeptidase n=1 Tax=Sneathiella litorea TaxID=2606216 RepID=A0A6L8W7P2_9PROT|nr:Xaa-Pro peptidase family protein [Sneathiella litorea]MZR30400.1 M24 family metallopeptidase [Sneathiella litorea]
MSFLSPAVYDYRRAKLDRMMDDNGLAGVVILGADFFQFFSNFHVDVLTWERPIALIIPREGEPVAILNALSTHHIGFARDRGSLWTADVNYYCEFPLGQADRRNAKNFLEQLTDKIGELGLSSGTVGIDTGAGWLTKVQESHPGLHVKTLAPEFRSLRWIKHDEEIQIMQDMGELSDWMQDHYREGIRPGRLVHELDYSIATKTFEEAANRFPGENFELRFFTLSGPSSSSPHGDTGQAGARIAKGDGIVNILIPRLNGVTIENERTYFCGQPSDLQKRAFEAARLANQAAIDQLVAGNPVSSVDEEPRRIFTEHGFAENIMHRTGHGMGLIGHEFPEDMAFNNRPLMVNEVYSAEPGIYLPGVGGFRFDDSVVISENGPRVLTNAPKDLNSQTIN